LLAQSEEAALPKAKMDQTLAVEAITAAKTDALPPVAAQRPIVAQFDGTAETLAALAMPRSSDQPATPVVVIPATASESSGGDRPAEDSTPPALSDKADAPQSTALRPATSPIHVRPHVAPAPQSNEAGPIPQPADSAREQISSMKGSIDQRNQPAQSAAETVRLASEAMPGAAPESRPTLAATQTSAEPAQMTITAANAAQPFPHIGSAAPMDANSPAPAMQPSVVPIAGLAVEIAARAREGKSRFEIRLDPPELGRIDVRLDIDREGNVTSRLVVDRSETLDVLRRNAHSLERALEQAGLSTSQGGLEFSLRHNALAGRDQGPSPLPRPSGEIVVPDPEGLIPNVIERRYRALPWLGAGVDIRV
jgi:flagellar hook-length control protein FliK